MIRVIFIIFLLLFPLKSFTQTQGKNIYIEKITTTDKVFHGTIDEYPIALYLKYGKVSGGNTKIYSVQGWYYYDKYQKRIPLVGIYDGDLTLYVFDNPSKEKQVIDFEWNNELQDLGFWDYVEYYKNLNGYKEKFIYSTDPEYSRNPRENEWTDNNHILSLSLETTNISLLDEKEYLKLPNSKNFINLYDYNIHDKNFGIINYKVNKSGTEILLKYDYTVRAYMLGMCGMGNEIGYFILRLDSSSNLKEIKRIPLQSCEESFSYSQINKSGLSTEIYELGAGYDGKKTLPKKIILNTQTITLQEE